jgi:L-arabinose isomerase
MLFFSIHGWFRPDSGIEDFLTEFSMAGGTHHSVLCYTTEADIIKKFGKLMGWDTVLI